MQDMLAIKISKNKNRIKKKLTKPTDQLKF
jgi:hypothetical protein